MPYRHLHRVAAALVLAAFALLAALPAVAASPDAHMWDADIAAFEAQDKANPPARGGVLFIGSSSIRMWTTLAQDFPGVDVVNRGFGGSEIRDSTRYASRLIKPHAPRLVVLYAGDNDLMNGRTPRQVEKDFKDFVQRVRRQAPDAGIAFISIKPSPSRVQLLDQARDANRRIARAAATLKGVDFIDVMTPMLDAQGQPRAELFLEDMLHLNAEGYRLWTATVRPYLGT